MQNVKDRHPISYRNSVALRSITHNKSLLYTYMYVDLDLRQDASSTAVSCCWLCVTDDACYVDVDAVFTAVVWNVVSGASQQ